MAAASGTSPSPSWRSRVQSVSPGFLDIFDSNEQALEYRVELLQSSGFNFPENVGLAIAASSTKNTYRGSGMVDNSFKADNLADGQAAEPFKYAGFDMGVWRLDGGFRLLGEGAKYTPGWWSEVRSDGSGSFASPPYVEVVFSPYVEANRIRVSTTSVYPGAHTVNVQAWYQGDPGYTNLGDKLFGSGSRVVVDIADGAELRKVIKIKVAVKKTKTASTYARLTEIEPIVEWSAETLGTLEDWCENIQVRKSSGSVSAYTPASPGFGINELSFSLSKECWITPAENQLVILSAGFGGELLQQGVFIISEANEGVDFWNITAHGVLSLSAYHRYPDSVFQGIKPSVLIGSLLEWIGFAAEEASFSLASDVAWEWYIVESGPCDECLRKAAETFGVAIYEDELGQVHARSSYGASALTITDDLIEDISQTKPREINYVVVHYGNIRKGLPDVVLSGSAPLAASETKTFIFRMSKSPAMELKVPFIESFKDSNNQDLTLPTITAWAADAYSLTVTVRNNVASAGTFAIKLSGTPLDKGSNEAIYEAKDVPSIRRRGIRDIEATIYTNSAARAKTYGDKLLKYLQACSGALTLTLNRPAPHLQLRDVVHVDSSLFEIDADYVIAEIAMPEDSTELTLIPKGAVV